MPTAADLASTTLLHLLHRASQRADGLFMSHLPEAELTPRQFAVLEAVAQKDGISQTDIMHATGIDRSSTADLVRRLVKGGYLQRRRTRRDARAYAVKITASGRKLRALGIPAAGAVHEELLAALSMSERVAFVGMLERIGMKASAEC